MPAIWRKRELLIPALRHREHATGATGSIEPLERRVRRPIAEIRDCAGRRCRHSAASAVEHSERRGRIADDDRLSQQSQAAGVEPLGDELAIPREQQVAGRCVDCRPACGRHGDPRRAVDRADEQIEFLIARRQGGVEEVLAVRQEPRKPMTGLAVRAVEGRDVTGLAAIRRDALQRSRVSGREDDSSPRAPRASTGAFRRAEDLDGAAGGRHLPQLVARKERNLPAVGRPEGKRCALRAG